MINKKLLAIFLTISIVMILYVINQYVFLNILVDPSNTKYAWINNEFTGYLLADSRDYITTANEIDRATDTCAIFIDVNTSMAAYTDECDSQHNVYNSESIRTDDVARVKYSSMYEYLYGVSTINPLSKLENKDIPRYNQIYVKGDEDISKSLPQDLNFAKEKTLYSTYSQDYKSAMLSSQIKILAIACLVLFSIFFIGYVELKRKEFYVYRILGVNNRRLTQMIYKDMFFMFSFAFVIGFIIFASIVYLNGRLFYMEMFFEYLNIYISILLYMVLMVLTLICTIIYYGYLRRGSERK